MTNYIETIWMTKEGELIEVLEEGPLCFMYELYVNGVEYFQSPFVLVKDDMKNAGLERLGEL